MVLIIKQFGPLGCSYYMPRVMRKYSAGTVAVPLNVDSVLRKIITYVTKGRILSFIESLAQIVTRCDFCSPPYLQYDEVLPSSVSACLNCILGPIDQG